MDSRLALYLSLGIIASGLLALGLLMMKSRGAELPAAHGSNLFAVLRRWIRDPVWSGGLAVQSVGYALYLIALTGAPVSMLAVMMQGGIALFVVFAAIFLGERATISEWTGIAGIGIAMILLALSLQNGAPEGAVNASALALLSLAGVTLSVVPYVSPRIRNQGLAAAMASGVSFGLGSLYPKAIADALSDPLHGSLVTTLFVSPWLYLTIIANVTGLILLQNSFHVSRGIIAMPLSSACSNLMPIAGGILAFGENLPADRIAASMRMAAFGLTILSSFLLAFAEQARGALRPEP
jgi:drug/metabolite transporter (DMT)-like permease